MNKHTGYLCEMFVSYQGEGPWTGIRQLFIRLAGCSRGCDYCDTRKSWAHRPAHWKFYPDHNRHFIQDNPLTVAEVIQVVRKIRKSSGIFNSIAITGGEPLEQSVFLAELVAGLRANFKRTKILLETNGLEDILDKTMIANIGFFSLDFKIKSTSHMTINPGKAAKNLKRLKGKKGCIKVVVNEKTRSQELLNIARLVHKLQPKWEMIIQPASGGMKNKRLLYENSDKIILALLAIHPHIRFMPQMHRYIKLK